MIASSSSKPYDGDDGDDGDGGAGTPPTFTFTAGGWLPNVAVATWPPSGK